MLFGLPFGIFGINVYICTNYPTKMILNYFTKTIEVFNERALLQQHAGTKIPDRVVKTADGFVVIDFKTGAARNEHIQQINEYAALLGNAGLPVSRKIIYYTESKKAEVLP